ncbi:MAG: putative hydro-lyase [Planctomycetota bacterium]|nr:MAG: putative hydro-lyase [Planctomycetota bacterium]
MTEGWSFWIDRGGTFTDVVALDPSGRVLVKKLLSEHPEQYEDAPLAAIRTLLGVGPGEELADQPIRSVRMGTTVATNALLERTGARVCLVISAGFEDLLRIGTQDRPDLFSLEIRKPEPLVAEVVGVDEEVDAHGRLRRRPDPRGLRAALERARTAGAEAVAIVFKNAYLNPANELAAEAVARELDFAHVGLSHRVVREIGLTGRGDTTAADAYLTPILRRYVAGFQSAFARNVSLRFMQSNGGLADAARFAGKDAILSGPAGGVVACAHVARQAGFARAIGFDMGGTSTDVCRVDTREGYERVYERVIAGVRIKAPMLNVVTIAAGGGSLCAFDGRRLTVGPESAGADPGPVCYRRPGGRLALTDANAVLGRVQPRFFPRCFGPRADEPLDAEGARAAMRALAEQVTTATGVRRSPEELAAGFVRIANDNMARAIREISVARGYDVSEYALVCFGGAAAQHACAIAAALGMRAVVVHPLAGVLSAYGMGLADIVHTDVEALLLPLRPEGCARLREAHERLRRAGTSAVRAQGVAPERIRYRPSADLRYVGVDASLNVPAPPLPQGASDAEWAEAWREAFDRHHERLYGFTRPGHPVELLNARMETVGSTEHIEEPAAVESTRALDAEAAIARVTVRFPAVEGEGLTPTETPVFRRASLRPGDRLQGPALVSEEVGTVVVDPGWEARVDGHRNLVLTPTRTARPRRERVLAERDPVFLEIMGNLYMSIAEQMGAVLRRVSLSVNIKERLDFSCAVFDGRGELVANAPHIPVHLGAMGESVKAIRAARGDDLRPGDVLLTNDPYQGGSHLPDVTVVSPVFLGDPGAGPTFFVANRGHHADIGGVVPGSMPPHSRSIDEEGVRLHDVLLVREGRFRRRELEELLTAGPWPVRGVAERIADLEAQVAANALGARLLEEMSVEYGVDVVRAYMQHVQDDAAAAMREAIAALPDGEHRFVDHLDDGARIAVAVIVSGDRATVDFRGTDPALPGNLNAPRAVVLAAVLYVFRSLVARPVPLNAGCFRPIEVIIPAGSLLDPRPPAAVVGGNVETSQRIVDVLYGALGKLGAAQGTMNNFTFGTGDYGYYETIGGGAGAGLGFDGASAVHTHMTNTRITDPEVLERRFPVALRRFAIRRGSGGAGVWRGGDGVIREFEFLAPMQAALLSERRAVPPYGAHGAAPGLPGRGRRIRGSESLWLPGKACLDVAAGDRLVLETPGGGGYDPRPEEWARMPPPTARNLFRQGRWRGPTAGVALGHVQANLVVLPADLADAFEDYCRRNPAPCPLLERLSPGAYEPRRLAPGADLRRDLPRYRLHRAEGTQELDALDAVWSEDAVAFLIGCSFSSEEALLAAGIPVRHIEERKNVPMFRTNRRTRPAGPFAGELVVTLRPLPRERVDEAARITDAFWHGHGAPVHVGDPEALGILDLERPDWGDPVRVRRGEVAVFWACGVTTQVAVQNAIAAGALAWALTHAPGCMFVADATNEELVAQDPRRDTAFGG